MDGPSVRSRSLQQGAPKADDLSRPGVEPNSSLCIYGELLSWQPWPCVVKSWLGGGLLKKKERLGEERCLGAPSGAPPLSDVLVLLRLALIIDFLTRSTMAGLWLLYCTRLLLHLTKIIIEIDGYKSPNFSDTSSPCQLFFFPVFWKGLCRHPTGKEANVCCKRVVRNKSSKNSSSRNSLLLFFFIDIAPLQVAPLCGRSQNTFDFPPTDCNQNQSVQTWMYLPWYR